MRADPYEKPDDGIRAMTILISAFGVAGRFAGDLLMTALGWASSLLFGRVPRTHQVFLVLMMALSFLWIMAVVALLVPTVASTLLATTPHPPFVDNQWFGFAVLLSVILLPLCVGAAGYLVPAEGDRPGGVIVLREVLRGYLLAPVISGLLIFLAGVGIARKVRSRRNGWSDVHVAIVVEPGGYDQLVTDVQKALDSADLPVTAGERAMGSDPAGSDPDPCLREQCPQAPTRSVDRPDEREPQCRGVPVGHRHLGHGARPHPSARGDRQPPRDRVRPHDHQQGGAGGRRPTRETCQAGWRCRSFIGIGGASALRVDRCDVARPGRPDGRVGHPLSHPAPDRA